MKTGFGCGERSPEYGTLLFSRFKHILLWKKIAERMITMCKVYEFPKNMELPKDEKEILTLLGGAYVVALYNSLTKLVGDNPDREKYKYLYENKYFVKEQITGGRKDILY